MARRKNRSPAVEYLHPPSATVPLKYPFKLFGWNVLKVDLDPPPYDVLEALTAAEAIDGRDLVAALTGEDPVIVGRIRWPDIEEILTRGKGYLPPDLWVRFAEAERVPDGELSDDEGAAPDETDDETDPMSVDLFDDTPPADASALDDFVTTVP